MAGTASSGGGGTINGVVYQLLWSLLHVAKIRVRQTKPDPKDPNLPSELLLVLEPCGGGGDLQLRGKCSFAVEQIKARSDGSTWPLREIIEDVFPDLFLAAAQDSSASIAYRFVTEGRMGAWSTVYGSFFQTLRDRKQPDDLLSRLDQKNALKFTRHRTQGGTPFFPDPVTERSLFLKIAEVIAERPAVKSLGLKKEELYEKVWRLLSGFEFDGGHPIAEVQEGIDSILLALVDRDRDIPALRDHLAIELAKAAVKGDAEIEADSFLAKHGLSAIPLSDWVAHRNRASALLQRTLARRNYQPSHDIRRDGVSHVSPRRVVAVTGESGTGKSWMMNALAEVSTSSIRLPVLIESTGSADGDLQKVSEVFWYDIHDGDEALHLSRVARRLRTVAGDKVDIGLTVFVDGIQSYAEASRLAQNDWIGWNCSLVLSCSPAIARSLTGAFPDQIDLINCQNFSWEQLHELLDRRLGSGWPAIREDVRDVLKVPLLAGIYCDEFGESGWLPTSEYELYERVWKRLSSGSTASLLNESRVESLARSVLEGGSYPWTGHQLLECGVDDASLERLIGAGWVVGTGDGRFRIFHGRLLQWAVAKALCTGFSDGRIALAQLAKSITEIVEKASPQKDVFLGFVPMDVLWILAQAETPSTDIESLLAALEETTDRYSEGLYDELVPTLGKQIAEAVFGRYRTFKGPPWIRKNIAAALKDVAGDRIEEFARPMIASADAREQRLGVTLLNGISCPSLLDQLWQIHLAGQKDPAKFDDEKIESWQLYRETFDVLKTAVQRKPEWLTATIARADEAERIEDLAWLVANIEDDGAVWRQVKKDLFAKISAEQPRSLLACIGRHRDREEITWVKRLVKTDKGFTVGPLALQTLARLDPDEAVASLPDSDPDDVAMSRRWAFAEVFARRPEKTHATLLEWMRRCDDPWKVGLLFQENENDLTADELRLLLDALEQTLSREIASEKCGQHGLHREFEMLSHIAAPHLLDVLQERAATSFETTLRDYLLCIGPRQGIWMDSAVRDPAIAVLNLLGSDALADVVNAFLENSDQYGREDAIGWSAKRPNDTTIRHLSRIVVSDDQWNGDSPNPHPISQNSAMRVLAGLGHWHAVAEGLKKWGMKTSPDIESPAEPITDAWMNQLRADAEQTPTTGNIIALGTVGQAADCTLIHKALDSCDAQSELAHACLVALENLGDQSDDGVRRVSPHLQIKKHHYSATRMLSAAGTPLAWQSLFEDVKRHLDFITALNLINLSDHADETTALVLERWPAYHGSDQIEMLRLLIMKIRKDSYRERILGDPGVRELIHQLSTAAEGSFWFTGSKAAMIECLALFNQAAAYAAARRCLEDEGLHDRELYPALLMEIDPDKAVDFLIDHCANERSAHVRYAIGRVLENRDLGVRIFSLMESTNPSERKAACFLASWMPPDERTDRALCEQLDDSSIEIVAAALAARRMRADRAIAKELLAKLESENDPRRKSVLLDAFIGIADPGGEREQLSPPLVRALQSVGHSEAEAALKRVKKRRKKLAEKLKKAKD